MTLIIPKITNILINSCLSGICTILDARRIVEHSPHNFAGLSLHVSLFEEADPEDSDMDLDYEETRMDEGSTDSTGITIIASGMAPSTMKDAVRNYFENSRRSGGGEVCDLSFTDDGDALITFSEVEGNRFLGLCFGCVVWVCNFRDDRCKANGSQ